MDGNDSDDDDDNKEEKKDGKKDGNVSDMEIETEIAPAQTSSSKFAKWILIRTLEGNYNEHTSRDARRRLAPWRDPVKLYKPTTVRAYAKEVTNWCGNPEAPFTTIISAKKGILAPDDELFTITSQRAPFDDGRQIWLKNLSAVSKNPEKENVAQACVYPDLIFAQDYVCLKYISFGYYIL